jgi:hypothetical protein
MAAPEADFIVVQIEDIRVEGAFICIFFVAVGIPAFDAVGLRTWLLKNLTH